MTATSTKTSRFSVNVASLDDTDSIILGSEYAGLLSGDNEQHEDGFLYGLEDGTAVLVTWAGKIIHFED
jgi:hypothetical protein